MTEGRDHSSEVDGNAEPQHEDNDHGSEVGSDRPTIKDFRRRVDLFWGDPRTLELGRTLNQGTSEPSGLPPAAALATHLSDTIAILESKHEHTDFRLQKSLTLRDGQLTSISGDEHPLPPDDRVLVVTTTTTVMDSDSLAVETNVLVFEREA